MAWIRYIPGFLLKTFVRLADRNIRLAKRYGKVAVTAVGMFSREPVWFIPHGSATVLMTAGSIEKRMVFTGERHEEREFLCLTGSFDHDIVDGAPAARFMNQFLETLKSGMGFGGAELSHYRIGHSEDGAGFVLIHTFSLQWQLFLNSERLHFKGLEFDTFTVRAANF